MLRLTWLCFAIGVFLLSTGCEKSSDRERKAYLATGNLMPAGLPEIDVQYIEDQSKVKVLPAREISYSPLESFKGRSKENDNRTKISKRSKPPKKRGPIGKLKQRFLGIFGGSTDTTHTPDGGRQPTLGDDTMDDEDDFDDEDEDDEDDEYEEEEEEEDEDDEDEDEDDEELEDEDEDTDDEEDEEDEDEYEEDD